MPVAVAAVPALFGAYQAISGGVKAHTNEKLLEQMKPPTYTPNKGILDYYSEALRRYNTDPLQTRQYKEDAQRIARSTAQGLGALQDRRSGVSGVNALVQGQNDALLRAGTNAENERNRLFGVLGNAARAKAGEEQKAFQQNQLYPYENKFNLLAQKAGQGASTMNAGIGNINNGLQNAAMIWADQKINKDPNRVNGIYVGASQYGSDSLNGYNRSLYGGINPATQSDSSKRWLNSGYYRGQNDLV